MKQNKRRVFDSVIFKHLLRKQTRDADDAEEWRSDEDGRHYKIETETGEIKSGFGGKLNGQTVKSEPKAESKPEAKKDPSELSFEELMGWLDDPETARKNTEKYEQQEREEKERQDYGQFGLAESEYPEDLRLNESEREQVNNILRGFRDPSYKSRGNVDLEHALAGWGSTLAQKEEQYKKQLAEAEEMIKERKAQGYSYKERHQGETGAQRKEAWWRYYNEHGEAPDGVGESGIQHWQKQRKRAQEALNGLELAKKVAAREEFARKNEHYMPWRKNPNSENQGYRPWVKDAEPVIVPTDEVEDGGPGSGNWGHRGRPGLVGGSGKGGGAHYRGGRSDIMYVGSRHDWLNGLTGERQHEVANWLKSEGKGDIKAGEKEIMTNGTSEERLRLIGEMAAARKWDDYAPYYYQNLTEEEGNVLDRLLTHLRGDTINEMIAVADATLDIKETRMFTDLMSKAMGGETSGESILPSKEDIADQIDKMDNTGRAGHYKNLVVDNLAKITGFAGTNRLDASSIKEMVEQFPSKAFATPENVVLTNDALTAMGWNLDYATRLNNAEYDSMARAALDVLGRYGDIDDLVGVDNWDIGRCEQTLMQKGSKREIQNYLSWKYQIMGGKPLTVTAKSLADRRKHAESVSAQRQNGTYAGDPSTNFAQKMGKHYAKANEMVNKCKDTACVKLWDGVEDDVRVLSTRTSANQHYAPKEGGIYIDAKGDMEEHSIYSAGEVVFHESGHLIDDLLGRERGLDGYYSEKYNNGEFVDTMHNEVKQWAERRRKEIAEEFEASGHTALTFDNITWLGANGFFGFTDEWEWKEKAIKSNEQGTITLSESCLTRAIAVKMRKLSVEPGKLYNTACDMIQGCTKNAIKPGIGHRDSYYSGPNSRHNVATETFAGLFSTAISNPAANEAFKAMFPKTYGVFEKMVAEAFS